MKKTPVEFKDLERSVIAVPPLARPPDFSLCGKGNAKIVETLERGGVRSLMYGGNANFYHLPTSELARVLDLLEEIAGEDTWVLPSAGPDYGRLIDSLPVFKGRDFPSVMVLPALFPTTIAGVATGIRRFSDALGKPVILYLKREGYLGARDVASLVNDGYVAGIKYAIVRENPSQDGVLSELCDLIDKRFIISGIGERPVVEHWRDFGLRSFTSGSVCVAPRLSEAILAALRSGNYSAAQNIVQLFLPIEDLRDEISPMRVLHCAVREAGVADSGPLTPLVDECLAEAQCERVRAAAQSLRAAEEAHANLVAA